MSPTKVFSLILEYSLVLKLVCIPAYNEEGPIADVIKRASNYADKVIVYDDGSTDQTSKEAKKAGAFVIRSDKNRGKGAALKSLFDYAKENNADAMVTIDGDGQFLPEEIPKLLNPILEKKSDVVIGYRFDDVNKMPNYRKFGNKVLDKITNLASELPFKDTQSGFRSYSKKAINSINFVDTGFSVDSEILVSASRKDLKISEEKVTVIYDTGGKTSTTNPISHSSAVINSLLELIILRYPLKYLGIPGIAFIIFGVIYSGVVIAMFNEDRIFSIPSSLLALGTLMVGLTLVLVAFILYAIKMSSRRGYD